MKSTQTCPECGSTFTQFHLRHVWPTREEGVLVEHWHQCVECGTIWDRWSLPVVEIAALERAERERVNR